MAPPSPPSATIPAADLLADLHARGLIHQVTDEPGLLSHLQLQQPRRIYAGFDPTADSLTIGNLVPLMLLRRLQLAGHAPIVVAGGGTGLIGDPSGKSAERELQDEDRVRANVQSQLRIYQRVLDFDPALPSRAQIRNNLDWLGKLGYIEVLRDVGKHFSVNMMIQKESIRERLHAREQGISYTEFSYMILQAYDFYHLFKHEGVTVQLGGSDQWGNIVAGVDLIRRMMLGETLLTEQCHLHHQVFGLTTPLLTKADGGKFGKTETGAVWLTADRTSPYAFYQFWLNTADADLERFFKVFSLRPVEEIAALMQQHAQNPGAREAHRALAAEVTDLMHGREAREHAEAAARALFSGDLQSIPESMLDEALSAAPSSTHNRALLTAETEGAGIPLLDLLPQTTIAKSKSEARQLLSEGSISINGQKAHPDARLTPEHLLHNRIIALRRGKKTWHITRWE